MSETPDTLPALPPRFLPFHWPILARAAGGCPDPTGCTGSMPASGEDAAASCTRCRAEIAATGD